MEPLTNSIALTRRRTRDILAVLEDMKVQVNTRVTVMAAGFTMLSRSPKKLDAQARANLMKLPAEIFDHQKKSIQRIQEILQSTTVPPA